VYGKYARALQWQMCSQPPPRVDTPSQMSRRTLSLGSVEKTQRQLQPSHRLRLRVLRQPAHSFDSSLQTAAAPADKTHSIHMDVEDRGCEWDARHAPSWEILQRAGEGVECAGKVACGAGVKLLRQGRNNRHLGKQNSKNCSISPSWSARII
jgi:hypothetical protein